MTFVILYAFCPTFVCIFEKGLKAPGVGGIMGQNKAVAPGGAWDVAGIVRHRVTLSLAEQGLSAGGQRRLICT